VVQGIARPVISLTGGEPLLQKEFLLDWLPRVRKDYTIYLETCGIDYGPLKELRDYIDVVSMDMKLPSSTGLRSFWNEHREFLAAALGKELFVKAVVTGDTTMEDIKAAAAIIAGTGQTIRLIIQPASGPLAPSSEKLLRLQEAVLGTVRDVRIIPQIHKVLNLP
jgi:organic radical activating enzyme